MLPDTSVAANVALLLAALWFTLGGLGCRRGRGPGGRCWPRRGVWTEPFLRTVYLGQVNVALMALIMWDLTQPDARASRWWKGAGVASPPGSSWCR